MEQIEIALQLAPDDPIISSPKFQAELEQFSDGLNAADIEFSQPVISLHAVEAGDYSLPEFLIRFGPAIISPLALLCGAWLQARYGRRVRLKVGDVEAEARTPEELEQLLKRAQSFKAEAVKGDQEQKTPLASPPID